MTRYLYPMSAESVLKLIISNPQKYTIDLDDYALQTVTLCR